MRLYASGILVALLCLGGMTTSAFAVPKTWYVTGIFESSNNKKPALTGSFEYDPTQFNATNVALTAETGETTTPCCLISWDTVVFRWSSEAIYTPNDGRFYMFLYLSKVDAEEPTPFTTAMGLVFTGNPANSNKLEGVLDGQSVEGSCFIEHDSCAGVNRTGGALFPHRDLISLSMSTTPPSDPAPLPLPGAAPLMGAGLLALAGFGLRRRRHG